MFINHGLELDSSYRHSIVYTGMHGVKYTYVLSIMEQSLIANINFV